MTKSEGEAIRYHRLTVIADAPRQGRTKMLLCRCDCGVEKAIAFKHLSSGSTKSCGCWHRERGALMLTKHGLCKSRTYKIWCSMRYRCTRPSTINYPLYGGRGITVCDRWSSFEAFLADMGHAPDGQSIDRYPDKDGNYEPSNCRWATHVEQNRNMRSNRIIVFDGQSYCVTEWEERLSLPKGIISVRLQNGWDEERALTTPPRTYKKAVP